MLNQQSAPNGNGHGRPKSDIDRLLDDLFGWYTAKDLKEELSQWYTAAAASPVLSEWEARERADLAFLQQQLIDFFNDLEQARQKTAA